MPPTPSRNGSLALVVVIAAGAACVSPGGLRHGAPKPTSCPTIQNVDAVLTPGEITLFGELHGTDQSPAFVAAVVCNAAARRRPVTLALELPTDATAALERYVRSPGSPADRDALLANALWHDRWKDGRTSLAMLRLLDSARALVQAGADVAVLAFSHPPELGGQLRDSLMAVTLAQAATREPARVIIGLTGNLHSQSALGTSRDSTYRPMTYLLRGMVPARRVLGLNVTYDGGTAWICPSDGVCDAHRLSGHMRVPLHSIQLGGPDPKYDGLYGVGPLTASSPTIP